MKKTNEQLHSREYCIATHTCICCGGSSRYFVDELSRKDFYISGMCQQCQNKTFIEEEEEDNK